MIFVGSELSVLEGKRILTVVWEVVLWVDGFDKEWRGGKGEGEGGREPGGAAKRATIQRNRMWFNICLFCFITLIFDHYRS